MRLFARFLLLFFLGSLPLFILGQRAQWDFKGETLKEVLVELEQSYGLRFAYGQGRLTLAKAIFHRANNLPLDTALVDLLGKNNLAYQKLGQLWALKDSTPKEQWSLAAPVLAPKQQALAPQSPLPYSRPLPPKIRLSSVVLPPLYSEGLLISLDAQPQAQGILVDWGALWKEALERQFLEELSIFQLSFFGTAEEQAVKAQVLALDIGWGRRRQLLGLQLSLGASRVEESAMGFQFALLANQVKGELMGLQAAGFYNQTARLYGSQLSLGLNRVDSSLSGSQFALFGNLALGQGYAANSLQLAGLFNYSRSNAHAQLGGYYNRAPKLQGCQLSLGLNDTDSLQGLQLGSINYTGHLQGCQLGLLNICDTAAAGLGIGLLNIYKKGGYNRISLGGSAALHAQQSLQIGHPRFYTIYEIGQRLDQPIWLWGFGLGCRLPMEKGYYLQPELLAYSLQEGPDWTNRQGHLLQLRALFSHSLGPGLELLTGPELNFVQQNIEASQALGQQLLWQKKQGDWEQRLFWGWQLAVRYKLW
ncbi:hypothetical protein SapgrDRAFT_1207 [Saprospira grandis DSM 2844]|uniref:Uncharacterized protein n=1 Tax=Saprospira grandis DSM 2844 TaxID=694433 RepID=J1I2K0_9BACT|nr:hypothetical protein [Saprospira grandis]EJF52930.1 hypothetical protein SapgrDRAFT_1207 [Saprospira grandis DSM 2844]